MPSFSLRMLNVWIGLCQGVAGLPRDLRELGYKPIWIEFEFRNAAGRNVKPELIASSSRRRHSLLFEWKRGANTDADQLARYADITANELRDGATLPTPSWETHDIVVVGASEHSSRLQMGVSSAGHAFPVLVVDANGFERVLNSFSLSELNLRFAPRLDFDPETVPLSYVPIDEESTDDDVAAVVIPAIIDLMVRQESRIVLPDLAAEVVPQWSNVSDQQRGVLKGKIRRIIDLAAEHDFRLYIRPNRAAGRYRGGAVWDLIDNPLESRTDRRRSNYRSLRSRQQRFLDALRKGEWGPIQEDLLSVDDSAGLSEEVGPTGSTS